MGCCSNNFSVTPTDVITSNVPHCLWLITVLFLHIIWEKLLIIFFCVTPKCAWLIQLNAHRCVWNDRMYCRRQWRNQTPSPWCTTHLEDDNSSAQLLLEDDCFSTTGLIYGGVLVLKGKLLCRSQRSINIARTLDPGANCLWQLNVVLRSAQRPWSIYTWS